MSFARSLEPLAFAGSPVADGVCFTPRLDGDRQCMLVIIGTDEYGEKDVPGIMDGLRENADSWRDLLRGLKKRGLTQDPELAIGDGAPGFWTALRDVCPTTREQRCWVHKTANVTGAMPTSLREKAKALSGDFFHWKKS